MAKQIICGCEKYPKCKLCSGKGTYSYEPGPQGWHPFRCPTCEGGGQLVDETGAKSGCPTCRGQGKVDPANPPSKGLLDLLWKTFFGA